MLGILLIAADVIFYIALFDLYWDFYYLPTEIYLTYAHR